MSLARLSRSKRLRMSRRAAWRPRLQLRFLNTSAVRATGTIGFCWLRDAALTLLALMNAGYYEEAQLWRDWLLRATAGSPPQIQIMYGLRGERRLRSNLKFPGCQAMLIRSLYVLETPPTFSASSTFLAKSWTRSTRHARGN